MQRKNKKDSGCSSKLNNNVILQMAYWESMQRGIQNPTLSWISLQGNILLMTIGTSIISFSLAICVWPCTLFNSKDMPSSVCTGVVITDPCLSPFQNTSHFIYFHSCHFQHHRVYEKLTKACSSVGLISLMDRVLCLSHPKDQDSAESA